MTNFKCSRTKHARFHIKLGHVLARVAGARSLGKGNNQAPGIRCVLEGKGSAQEGVQFPE